MPPQTRYAKSGDVSIAYQVVGAGPRDLVLVPGWVSNLEVYWEELSAARFFEGLAAFSRLILFDKRGTGLSDRVAIHELPTLETCGRSWTRSAASGRPSTATPREVRCAPCSRPRTRAGPWPSSCTPPYARRMWNPEHNWLPRAEEWDRIIEATVRDWGGPVGVDTRVPSRLSDESFRQWWARLLRMSASPAASGACSG
jgi:pimeloyl-ACP methyl ester carboxylesterase